MASRRARRRAKRAIEQAARQMREAGVEPHRIEQSLKLRRDATRAGVTNKHIRVITGTKGQRRLRRRH